MEYSLKGKLRDSLKFQTIFGTLDVINNKALYPKFLSNSEGVTLKDSSNHLLAPIGIPYVTIRAITSSQCFKKGIRIAPTNRDIF